VSEAELQQAVIELARLLGWRVAHFRPALTLHGYRTPVEADGAGFPDLVLVRDGRLIFAELKSRGRRLGVAQTIWADRLALVAAASAGAVAFVVWNPDDWAEGLIELALR
jgi:hypothetical protein